MKRVSEVFDGEIITAGRYLISKSAHAMFSDAPTAQHAAHAIKHVDALADALDECLEDMELEGKHDDRVYKLAKAALAAYRGGK